MVIGAVATRDLSADQMVTNLDVHRPLIVRRGDSLFLQVRKGGITTRVPAVAREDGAIGDRIVVTMTSNEHDMSGVVISRDMVELDLGLPAN
jgi:flagella basal body P-ring formation protein FlgA